MQSDVYKELQKMYESRIEKLASVFERGIREGLSRPLDPDVLARAFAGMTNTFLLEEMLNEDGQAYSFSARAPVIKEIFFHGIRRAGESNGAPSGND